MGPLMIFLWTNLSYRLDGSEIRPAVVPVEIMKPAGKHVNWLPGFLQHQQIMSNKIYEDISHYLRIFQHTPGTYPRSRTNSL